MISPRPNASCPRCGDAMQRTELDALRCGSPWCEVREDKNWKSCRDVWHDGDVSFLIKDFPERYQPKAIS